MSTVEEKTTEKTNTFDLWRQKTNLIAQDQGTLSDLTTTTKNSLVEAINEVLEVTNLGFRKNLALSIAMS